MAKISTHHLKADEHLLTEVYKLDAENLMQLQEIFGGQLDVPEENHAKILADLGEVVRLAQSVMKTFHETGTIDREQQKQLNIRRQRNYLTEIVDVQTDTSDTWRSWIVEALGDTNTEIVDVQTDTSDTWRSRIFELIRASDQDEKRKEEQIWASIDKMEAIVIPYIALSRGVRVIPCASISLEIVDLLNQLVSGDRNKIAACISCGTLFVKTVWKPYQRFCSARCASRLRMRNFRAAKSNASLQD